jgi:electron transport complex protein RnfG
VTVELGTSPAAAQPKVWPLYRAMVGVGILCGLLIVLVFQLTAPVIARNQAEALQAAILDVVPGAEDSRTFEWNGEAFVPIDGDDSSAAPKVYAAYDGSGELAGVAVEAASMGYADTIRMLYGYSPDQDAIVGLQVLESKETPGLGDRIETDPAFTANFEALDVTLDEAGEAPLHPIVAVKQGEKTEPWQVDGITGATISSKAIATALREGTGEWVPRLERRLADFRALPTEEGQEVSHGP